MSIFEKIKDFEVFEVVLRSKSIEMVKERKEAKSKQHDPLAQEEHSRIIMS